MSDGLIVKFSRPLTSTVGVTQLAMYRDEDSGELVAAAAFIPDDNAGQVRISVFERSPAPGEPIGTFAPGLAKSVLKASLLSLGYRRMRRA